MSKNVITINSIAEMLDISPSTVSRALSNKKGVSDELRNRILAVADDMNYRPNRIARSLRTKATTEIGVIIPDNSNPFFSAIVSGIDSYARSHGYTLLLINSNNDPQIERAAILKFNELQVAGLLAVPSDSSNYAAINIPVVFLTRCKDLDSKYNYIITDDVEGSYLATKNLITSNLTAYFFVCDSLQIVYSENRVNGYKKALLESEITPREEWVIPGVNNIQDGYRVFQEINSHASPPFGILCHNDYTAIGVLKSIMDSHLVPGKDVRLFGYDDIEIVSYMTPALSTVRQAKFDVGIWGARHLINLIESGSAQKPLHMVMKPELIIRET